MTNPWTEATLQQLIADEVQESITLEYKSAGSLEKTDSKRTEITKDISAMANSAGGVVIYGIREYQEPDKKHLPEKIDPVDLVQFSKERLENVINTIQPRIDGVEIIPVPLGSSDNSVAYVVKIPQSTTAHQARDHKYYKRYNFSSVPMENHEILDVMGRSKFPIVNLEFTIETRKLSSIQISKKLAIKAKNIGREYAQYVNCLLYLPEVLTTHQPSIFEEIEEIEGVKYLVVSESNTRRDVMRAGSNSRTRGTSWFDPILPARHHVWYWDLPNNFDPKKLQGNEKILWKVYVDNAPTKEGEILIREIDCVTRNEPPQKVARLMVAEEKPTVIASIVLLGTFILFIVWRYFS